MSHITKRTRRDTSDSDTSDSETETKTETETNTQVVDLTESDSDSDSDSESESDRKRKRPFTFTEKVRQAALQGLVFTPSPCAMRPDPIVASASASASAPLQAQCALVNAPLPAFENSAEDSDEDVWELSRKLPLLNKFDLSDCSERDLMTLMTHVAKALTMKRARHAGCLAGMDLDHIEGAFLMNETSLETIDGDDSITYEISIQKNYDLFSEPL